MQEAIGSITDSTLGYSIPFVEVSSKRKGKYFLHCINPNCSTYRDCCILLRLYRDGQICSKYNFFITTLADIYILSSYSMDHKGSISLLISSLGVNKLFHKSGISYLITKTPQTPTQQLPMIPLKDWRQI
jgi:hypothetical protein